MKPTPEQDDALAMFRTADNLAIEAGAGTGKTSTLVMLAQDAHGQGDTGQYVAFNRAIVEDGKGKFPRSVRCNTAHALAFRAVGHKFAHRLEQRVRMRSFHQADRLNIESITVGEGFVETLPGYRLRTRGEGPEKDRLVLSRTALMNYCIDAVLKFCRSADSELTAYHFPLILGIDPPKVYTNNNQVAALMLPFARKLWTDAINPDGALPYRHDYYLKLWQLNHPRITADYILFDEAQDASPVLLSAVEQQRDAQLVFVGDSQQQIYEWTGAVNALANLPASRRTFLTMSFRFGQGIADVANVLLERLGAELRLTGRSGTAGTVIREYEPREVDAILTRTNATAIGELIAHQAEGVKAHLVGGTADIHAFMRGVVELQENGSTSHYDLAGFKSWEEVREYVKSERDGDDLKLMVKLIEQFGAQTIIACLTDLPSEADADVIVSTAHKSKGREWERVRLAPDFYMPNGSEDSLSPSELRLLYVACTRAKELLHIGQLPQDVFGEGT